MARVPCRRILTVALTCLVVVPVLAGAATQEAASLDAEAVSGLRFRTIGPAAMSGRIVDVAVVESDTYVFYVATATGGLWKTTDNGVTFEPVFESQEVHSLGDVAVSRSDPQIVWVGTGRATGTARTSSPPTTRRPSTPAPRTSTSAATGAAAGRTWDG